MIFIKDNFLEALGCVAIIKKHLDFERSLLGFETKRKYGFKKRKFKKYVVKPSPYFSLYNKLFGFSILHEFLSILIDKTKNKE